MRRRRLTAGWTLAVSVPAFAAVAWALLSGPTAGSPPAPTPPAAAAAHPSPHTSPQTLVRATSSAGGPAASPEVSCDEPATTKGAEEQIEWLLRCRDWDPELEYVLQKELQILRGEPREPL